MGNKKIKGQKPWLFLSSHLPWIFYGFHYSCIQPLSPWKLSPSLPRDPVISLSCSSRPCPCSSSPSTEDFNVACISVLQFAFGSLVHLWALMPTTTDPLPQTQFIPFSSGDFQLDALRSPLKAAHAKWTHPWCPDLSFLTLSSLSGSHLSWFLLPLPFFPTHFHMGSCSLASLLLGPLEHWSPCNLSKTYLQVCNSPIQKLVHQFSVGESNFSDTIQLCYSTSPCSIPSTYLTHHPTKSNCTLCSSKYPALPHLHASPFA